ncbi:zinc-type alcohol dehydrogenase-like protein C1773.06c isoform X1 [Chelonus insularis]|uniref:zinc-type alcohol dehydrogenase-like protein C1773.06c isoform X1 n=2 Tax=Chelonus insularis TaxID=460826 RepID=UPI00158BE40C|nr:zinc-type alcohol dehydrogenase-like protein C1773.06c isoform X1 [Chelonus insularis]
MPIEIEPITQTHVKHVQCNGDQPKKMNKLCRQLSIESPSVTGRECVFSFDVPVPDVPPQGARIRVICAGACYHPKRSSSLISLASVSSASSLATETSVEGDFPTSLPHYGVRDAALFPGYEVAGIVESLGSGVSEDCQFSVGDRVILYPFEGIPNGYVEYLVVDDLKYLIKVPDNISLSVAAMLPAGALLAMNTVFAAHEHVQQLVKERGNDGVCKILIVGTGGLALWTLRIAAYYFSDMQDKVTIAVASLKDDGLLMAQEFQRVNVVEWNEGLYEKQLIERTMDACQGQVDVVIDFGTTSRSLHRSMQCLSKGGVVFVIKEVADRLLPKFSKRAEERQQSIKPVELGTLEQLQEIVQLVASGKIEPPPHTVFPAEEATDVVHKLCHSEIHGRAILRFYPAD